MRRWLHEEAAAAGVVCSPDCTAKVAITIDDPPRGGDMVPLVLLRNTHAMTQKLLAPLASAKVPVTAFVTECRQHLHPRTVARDSLALDGRGFRSRQSHLLLTSLSISRSASTVQYEADIDKGAAVTSEVLGSRPRVFPELPHAPCGRGRRHETGDRGFPLSGTTARRP